MNITIPEWLAKKNDLPVKINGEIIKETEKAIRVKIHNCNEGCTMFQDFLEDAKDNEYASHPCNGCLGRYGNECRTEWIPKSQIKEVIE